MITDIECTDYFIKATNWEKYSEDKYDTQFFIERKDDGEVLIAFLGSNSDLDWKSNFHFWMRAYSDCEVTMYVHSGFLRCWKSIRRYIESRVKELNPTSITVTGHSYGAAIAILCVEDMEFILPEVPCKCVTFGAPRVLSIFNWKKLKSRWETTTQYRNESDFVTCLPFRIMLYRHVNKLVQLGKKFSIFRLNACESHWVENYRKNIEEI